MNKEDLEKERFKLHQALCERNETIDELQQRIDKAIKYIEENSYKYTSISKELKEKEIDKILSILRGESDEK